MLQISHVAPRRVAPPWERERLEGSRSIKVGRESHIRPDPGPAAEYRRIFPTRSIGWDHWRQLFVITDRAAPGWREFVLEMTPAPMPEDPAEQEALERAIEHLPRITDQGQLMVGIFAPLTYAYVERRARERQEFLRLGAKKYAATIADRNRAIGKKRLKQTAADNGARLREIRRWFGPLSGSGEKIPLVPVKVDLSH
jgi:hypothetical protein